MPQMLFLVAYACSGVAGLVYEVSWTRLLALELGRGVAASSTVLAAFMGGLAAGAALAGRWASTLTPTQALRAYAWLEVAVAVLALTLPFELRALSPLFAAAYRDGTAGVLFGSVRLVACLGALFLPAMALGATFPVAVRWFTSGARVPASRVGRLYAANTLGAAAGALLAGFALLPSLGLRGTLLTGVAASLAAVGIALGLAARVHVTPDVASSSPAVSASSAPAAPRRQKTRSPKVAPAPTGGAPTPRPGLAAVLLAITGAATFVAEVGWTRVFALLVGPSTYAFASTVAVFITGLAAGAWLGALIGVRTRRPAAAVALLLGSASMAAAWAANAAGTSLPLRVMNDFASGADTPIVGHALLLAMTILPMAIAIGAAFPLGLQLAGGTEAPPRVMGAVYAANTVAAVIAALVTGFVLLPWLGLERTLTVATVLLAAGALVAAASSQAPLIVRALAIAAVPAALAIGVSAGPWNRDLLASGSYKYASAVAPGLDVRTALESGTLLYYRDGATATVSVKRLAGSLSLSIDGKVDASTAGDMLTQKLLAQLPLLLHGDAKKVGIIGLGSGVTLASALTHPVTSVDVLEISPEVVEASRLFVQGGAPPLDDPRTRLIVADGRTHLALSSRTYDVIVSEPSNPWMAGVAALFTREFFEVARRRLAEHGVLCQWVNTYDISAADLESVVATFTSVFPHTTLWLAGDGDLMMLGSTDAMEPMLERLAQGWSQPAVRADLQTVGVRSPYGLLSMLVGADRAASRLSGGAAIQTDDRMALEFSAPRALHTVARRDNVAKLRALTEPASWPPAAARVWAAAGGAEQTERAVMLRLAGAYEPAYAAAREAVAQSPERADALQVLLETAAATGRQPDVTTVLQEIVTRRPELVAPRVALSKLRAASGNVEAAIGTANDALAQHPDDPEVLEQLASIYADVGDGLRLAPVVAALSRFPERPGSRYYAAAEHFMRGELDAARQAAERAIALDPRYARAQNLLGAIHATRGDSSAARTAFEASLALDPQDPTTYQNLGMLELNTGNPSAAARLFGEALSLDPASEPARQGLVRARAAR